MSRLVEIVTSSEDTLRNQSLESVCTGASVEQLLGEAVALDQLRRDSNNLFHCVRASLMLSAIYRYYMPGVLPPEASASIPFAGYQHLLNRRFGESIDHFLRVQNEAGPSDGLASALASAYHQLAFQTLANQVRKNVRGVKGNQWMFRVGHPADHPLRIRPELLQRGASGASSFSPFPIVCEKTSVRMDFSHSAWSDIFFLGMDFPEGARVLNVSVDLAVRGRDPFPRPPIETYLRVIDRPVFRLASTDLGAVAEIDSIAEMFDFARDYLGLLKGAVIAAGLVPPGMEGCKQPVSDLMNQMVGPGLGLELVSKVNDIPKGSRLAVSTNLLGSLISVCMRATGQVSALEGPLQETDRRIVAARAILGEWIGGSGGGWQDSGGVWPGIKLICGKPAETGDPEYGVSRGCLLPTHRVLSDQEVTAETRQNLQQSLVLVHGGMAQNVGPILEMVTEKYLLRSEKEWQGRQEAIDILDRVVDALKRGDVREAGKITTRNFEGPLQQIIPWSTNRFTDQLIELAKRKYGDRFWGFWMLGGMAGGGMGFIFDPDVKAEAQQWLAETMLETKRQMQHALPFAMDPVVYDFKINDRGSFSELLAGDAARMPDRYYSMVVPGWLRQGIRDVSPQVRGEMESLSAACNQQNGADSAKMLLASVLPRPQQQVEQSDSLKELLNRYGFDVQQHEQIQADLRSGRIGLSQNRLSQNTTIEDVTPEDVIDMRGPIDPATVALGNDAISGGQVGVVTLAAGVGSRWTEGAGVCKALHPFCRFAGRHRSFLEVHLAKSRASSQGLAASIPHVFTTGYMTDKPIREALSLHQNYGYEGPLYVSTGQSVGLRTIPMVRDLRFAWEEMPQQVLDQQQQKMRESLRGALAQWARNCGEADDYTDNVPLQCMHPVGHWYELPNMLRNGTLRQMLSEHPQLRYLLLHNIDTLGATVDPGLLGTHISGGQCLSFEVITRRLDDRGGGLARVGGRPRLVEGLAMPDEELEFSLTYYNSMTTWIDIDQLLDGFGLIRTQLADADLVDRCVRQAAARMPTYITIKDVKKRWGHAQEDIFPVTQFEKLWGDMTAIPSIGCAFFVTELMRGQQLKQQAQLDGWLRDGSHRYIDDRCLWSD